MKLTVLAMGALAIMLTGLGTAQAVVEEANSLRIYSTASTRGELHDCGCKSKPLGGLARRATLLEQNKLAAAQTLIVDAGDWAADKGDHTWDQTQLVWELMGEMGYEVVTPGAKELLFGHGAIQGLYAREEIQVVSANVTDKNDRLLWPAFTTLDKAGIEVAVTGVSASNSYVFNVTRGKQTSDDFDFRDVTQSLRTVIPAMKAQSDVTVVLCYTSPADARRIAEEVPGIDVLIVGNNPGYQFNPTRVGDTLILRGGPQGKYLNELDLVFDGEGNRVDYNGEAIPVSKRVQEHPKFAKRVSEWEAARDVAAK